VPGSSGTASCAADSICCARLRKRHRGDDHRGAADLLRTATPDGTSLATCLLRLLDLKDEAHYGVIVVAPRRARDAVRWAEKLVDRAGGRDRAVTGAAGPQPRITLRPAR